MAHSAETLLVRSPEELARLTSSNFAVSSQWRKARKAQIVAQPILIKYYRGTRVSSERRLHRLPNVMQVLNRRELNAGFSVGCLASALHVPLKCANRCLHL